MLVISRGGWKGKTTVYIGSYNVCINILVRYSDIEGINPRVIDLLREVKDMLTASTVLQALIRQALSSQDSTGGKKLNVPKEHLQFLIEQRFSTPAIADILGVSPRTVAVTLSSVHVKFDV